MKPSTIIALCVIFVVLISFYVYTTRNTTHSKLYFTTNYKQVQGKKLSEIKGEAILSAKERYISHVKTGMFLSTTFPRTFNFTSNNSVITRSKIQDFLLAAQLSLVAYNVNENYVIAGCNSLGLKYVGGGQNGDCYIWIAKLGNITVIMIQGTEFVPADHNIWQVWDDLSVSPHFLPSNIPGKLSNMYVHYGLYHSLSVVWPMVSNMIDYSNPVWVVGHSLGAARSMLIRYFIPQTTSVRITNLGGLRSANMDFWYHVSPNTLFERILFEQDFAGDWQPLLPYYHPTEYFYWLTNGTMQYVNQRDWLNLSFADHSIVNSYIPALQRLANG